MLNEWSVNVVYRCANTASGNAIIERNHRSIKKIKARKGCSVMEAVYWYNVTPLDDEQAETAPANVVHSYERRVKGIDPLIINERNVNSRFQAGDPVWVRKPGDRCFVTSRPGVVNEQLSQQAVEVDGMPQHVRNLRHRKPSEPEPSQQAQVEEDSSYMMLLDDEGRQDPDFEGFEVAPEGRQVQDDVPVPRRGERIRGPPERYCDL